MWINKVPDNNSTRDHRGGLELSYGEFFIVYVYLRDATSRQAVVSYRMNPNLQSVH